MNTVSTKFFFFEVWFTVQARKAFEIEDNVNFDTNYWVEIIKIRYATEPKFEKYVKGYNFLSFAKKFGEKYGK